MWSAIARTSSGVYRVPNSVDWVMLTASGWARCSSPQPHASVSINSGGEKIYPEEVEAALKGHPDVFDALVVGVPDPRFGQPVAAVVHAREGSRPTLAELDAFVRSEIAGYADRFRDLEESAMAAALRAHGVDTDEFPPVVMSMIVASLARILVLEQGLGISRGHTQAQDFVRRYLDRFELPAGDPA